MPGNGGCIKNEKNPETPVIIEQTIIAIERKLSCGEFFIKEVFSDFFIF